MTDKLADDIERGQRAKRLLEDDLLTGAFEALETTYLAAWKSTKYNDTDGRERLWQAIQVVGLVRAQLESYARDGKLAQVEVDRASYGLRERPAA